MRLDSEMIMMQYFWLAGIMMATLIGSGAVMGMGLYYDHDDMHRSMHGGDDCWEHQDCQYDHEECEEHNEEYCEEEHEDCDYHNTEFYGCC